MLVTCILYLIFSKSYRPESKYDKLTKEVSIEIGTMHCRYCDQTIVNSCGILVQEEDQLIAEWEPEPLVPTETPSDREVDPAPIVTGYINFVIRDYYDYIILSYHGLC